MPPSRAFVPSTRVLAASLAALGIAALVFTAWPSLDLMFASWFVEGNGRFAGDTAAGRGLRQTFEIIPFALLGGLTSLALLRRFGGLQVWAPSSAGLTMLALSLALGPGLLVNGFLKNHSHRPRPVQVTEFGGTWRFRPFYRFDGACQRNCSFVSGEGAMGFWTLAPALLAPPTYRVVASVAALLLGTAAGVLRIAFGGHFLSDVVFAGLLTWMVVLACWWVVGRFARGPPGAPAILRIATDDENADHRSVGRR